MEGVINMTNKVVFDEQGNKVLDPLGRFTEEDMACCWASLTKRQ